MSLTWYEMLLRSRTFSLGICRDRYTYLDGVIMYEKIKPDLNMSPNYKWPTLNSQWHLEATFIRLFDQVSLIHLLNASHPLKIMSVVAVVLCCAVVLWWWAPFTVLLVVLLRSVSRSRVARSISYHYLGQHPDCSATSDTGGTRALTEPRQRAV